MPYAPIANPIPDSGIDQRVRDSATMKPSRIRLNQAGYRTVDVTEGLAKFYYVGTNLAFKVIDSATKLPAGTGSLVAKGFNSGTKMSVRASNWAGTVAGGDTRYLMSTDALGTTIPSTGVMEGTLPTTGLVEGGRYRIVIGTDTSHTFLVSNNIYGMVRDGVLKFFGANRSGAGPSWFHAPSHTKDGTLAVPSAPGAYQGGWYDCGDHLKEPQTMGYALAALATITATMPDRDADEYGASHANTLRTDGIPDMLNEAKFGADFFLRSWVRNGRSTGAGTGMITGVGDFGKDHGWWGRPENQDAMTEAGRGGARERPLRSELGANTLGDVAAGLAILSKRWRPYNAKWADTALMAAKDMYAYAKANPTVVSSPAYNGATDYSSNMALAATALLWATRDRQYLHDIAYNTTIGNKGHYDGGTGVQLLSKESWEGGWMVVNNPNLRKGGANTDWANRHQYALYAFYKLILANKDSALLYGVASEAERQTLAGRTIAGVIQNLNAISGTSQIVIDLPVVDPISGGGYAIRSSSDWFKMFTQQEWVWNRYQMGNSLEMYFYYDITKDFVEGKAGANLQTKLWNRDAIRQLIIRQMDYQFGVNPWDVSMVMGLGEKNFNHPHHRGANPEGRNTPGAAYGYRVPVGALYGAWDPTNASNSTVRDFWDSYKYTEVCLDGAATSVAIAAALANEVPLNLPPKPTVKVVYVSDTSATIEVFLDKYGTVSLDYGAGPLVRTKTVSSTTAGVTFKFELGGLTPSTQYFFDVTASDLSGNSAKTSKWDNPLPDGTPFSFTTKALPVGPADIQNVKVCNVTADSAEIMWFTPDGEHQSSICYGKTPVQDASWICEENVDVEGHPTKFHYVKIGNLTEKTDYWFKVGSDGVWDDNGGAYYRFRTPVRMANFSLYAVQYQWSGMPALGINVINNESRNYDSLSVRVYVRSTDTLKNAAGVPLTHIKSTSTGLVNVPLLFKDAMAARYDICQAYDGAGFNRPCDDPSWGLTWSWSTLNRGVQMLPPTRMPETCDATSNTCVYYFDLPLGPTMMQQGSRIRFDVMFAARSEYSKNITAGQIGLIDWVRAFVPSVPLYAVGDTGWFDALDQPLAAHPMGKETQDWSFMPHSVAGGDPVDFVGIPKVADQTAANALIDNLSDEMPLNPYMTVYRKGEFVYGFSPSYIEQAQKKAYWGANVKFDAPFDLPDGSVITLDRPTSLVRVKGTADIYDKLTPAAKGVITDIWVNGKRLTPAERAAAAIQNPVTKLWALDIPVRMGVGANNVDITIFGGAPVCSDTSTTCVAGCAFENGSWFVQFTKGKSTSSAIALRDPVSGAAIVSELVSDSSKVMVEVRDNDNNLSRTLRETVKVTLRSGRDSVVVTLTETGDSTGIFVSSAISISTIPGWTVASVSPKGGDTLVARYLDANDPEDSSSTWLRVKSLWPTPERGGIFRSCGGIYEARVKFDRALGAGNPSAATLVLRNGPGDSTILSVPGVSTTFDATTRMLTIPLVGVPENGTRTGTATIALADLSGATKIVTQALSDSVGPWIDSAKIVENLEGRLVDTIAVWTSEPMVAPSKTWFFSVTRGGTPLATAAVVVDSAWLSDLATGRWTVVVRTGIVKAGDFLRLVPAQVRDLRGNAAEDCPTLERELKLWVRQAPVSRAWIRDADGDGTADQVVVVYKRALRASESPASIRVRFGVSDSIRDAVVAPVAGDSVLTIALPVAYSRALTSGKALDGSGSVVLFKGGDSVKVVLTDSVGPALLSARLNYGEAARDTVVLSFSEPVLSVVGTSWMQILKVAATNLAISGAPIEVDPWTWKIAVDTGSVVPGDSVRPTAAGRFQDPRGKSAAILHPWIEVQGDDRPPARAWYSDVDGDGRVDRVTMVWARAPRTKPSFLLLWPSATGGFDTAGVASAAWVLQADGRTAIVNVGPFDYGVTSSPTADLGRQVSNGVATSFAIHDSVPPRLLTARLAYDGGTALLPADTLKIVFSEAVAVDLSSSGLEKLIAPAPLPVGYRPQVLSADGRNWSIPVDTLSIFPGDSIRPSALVGFSDASGNRPSVLHPWVSVEGAERPPLRAWMKDVDGDGAADQVTVLWARGPRTSPALSFLWPNGRGGFDSVGVAAGSWTLRPDGITAVLAVGPFAVGVTSSPTTDLGRQNSAGTITSFPVHDSIAAVMTSARLGYAQADGQPDTLHLTWSEPIVWSGGQPLAVVRTGLTARPVVGTLTTIRPDFLGATIDLTPGDASLTVFRSGDQIRLSPASAGTVADRFGNVVEDPTRWVPVVLGRRPPRFQITFDPNKLKYDDWVIQPGPALKLYVKSATSPDWIDFETGNVADGVVLKEQGIGPVISLNQPLRGKALLYDNQGTFVANVDLDLLGEAFYAGKLPMDASNQYQIKIQWNGTASTGKPAASGVYLMRLVLWQNVAGEDEEPEYRVVNQVYKCGWEVKTKK
jgi:hypothetical protein